MLQTDLDLWQWCALVPVRGDRRAGQVGVVPGAALIHPRVTEPFKDKVSFGNCFGLGTGWGGHGCVNVGPA